MRLNWRRSPSAEDRFETWIGQRYQERVLAGEVTATGFCPDDAFLQDLARRSKRIALSDPRVDHAASCPLCMHKLLAFRTQARSRRQKIAMVAAIAACMMIAAVWVVLTRSGVHSHSPETNLAAVPETVNLRNAGTLRGQQPNPLQSVSLPATRVSITIILPRFSEPGRYLVAVTRDQAGNDVLAEGTAMSRKSGDHEEISVELDLRRTATGKYFLATTHEQNQSSYYYPLQIK